MAADRPRALPEGGRLAWSDGRAVWVAEWPDGSARQLFSLPYADDAVGLAWSPDGRWLLARVTDFPSSKGEIRLLSADGGQNVRLLEDTGLFGAGSGYALSWPRPDRAIVGRSESGGVEIRVLDVDAAAGTASWSSALTRQDGRAPLALDVRGQRLLWLALDLTVLPMLRAVSGNEEPRALGSDARALIPMGWIDARGLVTQTLGANADLWRLDVDSGELSALATSPRDERQPCPTEGGLAFLRSAEQGVDLVLLKGDQETILAHFDEAPDHIACGAPERVVVERPSAGALELVSVDLQSGEFGPTLWTGTPSQRPHTFAMDNRHLQILVDQERVEVDLATGASTIHPQSLAYPSIWAAPDGQLWIGGVHEGRQNRLERDGKVMAERRNQLLMGAVSPDGQWLAWGEVVATGAPWLATLAP